MILDQIVAHKKEELQFDQVQVSLAELQSRVVDLPPTRDFEVALGQSNSSQISLIAEIKKNHLAKGSSVTTSIPSISPQSMPKTGLRRFQY